MKFKKVTRIYKEANLSTMSDIAYVLLLLKKCLHVLKNNMGNESIEQAQDILFELMMTADRKTVEGERLFTYYVYLNQCLVQFRISPNQAELNRIIRALEELVAAWESIRVKGKERKYRGSDIRL